MKKIIVVSILASISVIATAQEEIGEYNKKSIKKELRGFLRKPESYYNQKVEQVKTVTKLNKNISDLTSKVSKLTQEIKDLNLSLADAQKHILNLRNLSSYAIDGNYEYYPLKVFTSTGEYLDQGKFDKNIQYHVQVAALNNPSYTKPSALYADVKENFDGKNYVYDVDGFSDPDLAYEYALFLRENKIVPDAFVTKYVKGQRDFNYKYDNNTVIFVQKSQAAAAQKLSQPPSSIKTMPNQSNTQINKQYQQQIETAPVPVNSKQIIRDVTTPTLQSVPITKPTQTSTYQKVVTDQPNKGLNIDKAPVNNQPQNVEKRRTPIKVFDNRDEVENRGSNTTKSTYNHPMDVPKVETKTVPYKSKVVKSSEKFNESEYIHDAPSTPVNPTEEFYHEVDPAKLEVPSDKVIKQPSSGGMMIIE